MNKYLDVCNEPLFLLIALIFAFAFDASADETSDVICKIVDYSHIIGGPIMTVVIPIPTLNEQGRNITNLFNSSTGNIGNKFTYNIFK